MQADQTLDTVLMDVLSGDRPFAALEPYFKTYDDALEYLAEHVALMYHAESIPGIDGLEGFACNCAVRRAEGANRVLALLWSADRERGWFRDVAPGLNWLRIMLSFTALWPILLFWTERPDRSLLVMTHHPVSAAGVWRLRWGWVLGSVVQFVGFLAALGFEIVSPLAFLLGLAELFDSQPLTGVPWLTFAVSVLCLLGFVFAAWLGTAGAYRVRWPASLRELVQPPFRLANYKLRHVRVEADGWSLH